MAEAIQWVSRITTVALMMVVPMLGGWWLDARLHTGFWIFIGLALGLLIGFQQLRQIAAGGKTKSGDKPSSNSTSPNRNFANRPPTPDDSTSGDAGG